MPIANFLYLVRRLCQKTLTKSGCQSAQRSFSYFSVNVSPEWGRCCMTYCDFVVWCSNWKEIKGSLYYKTVKNGFPLEEGRLDASISSGYTRTVFSYLSFLPIKWQNSQSGVTLVLLQKWILSCQLNRAEAPNLLSSDSNILLLHLASASRVLVLVTACRQINDEHFRLCVVVF